MRLATCRHERVLCDPTCMQSLYARDDGFYHCDGCKKSCVELGWPSMLHCASGCEYDLCRACAELPEHALHVGMQYVGEGCTFLPNFLFE